MKSKTGKIILCAILAVILGIVVFVSCSFSELYNSMSHAEVSDVKESEPAVETEAPETQPAATEQTEEATEETTEPTEEVTVFNDKNTKNYLVVCKPVGGAKTTDTMILCSLNSATNVITMTSLDGNAEVALPEYKDVAAGEKAALNTVYGMGSKYSTAGSMELLNQTIYDNYGIRVDENLEIDLKLFSTLVRRLGSVEIELTEEEAKYLSDVTYRGINAGVQKMDATLAEAYVGMWTAGAEGVSTLSCQKKLVSAIVETAKTKKAAELQHIVVQTLPSITITMSQSELGDVLYDILPDLKDLSIASGGVYPAA